MKRRFLFILLGISFAAVSRINAQEEGSYGRIAGQVIDSGTGSAVTGAAVAILEATGFLVRSDLNGMYLINDVPTGSYTVRVFRAGYEPFDITGIQVQANETTRIDIPLPKRDEPEVSEVKPEVRSTVAPKDDLGLIFEMAAFEVTAEVIQDSEAGLLKARQKSLSIGDAIGSDTFSKMSLGDAAEAMTKMTGASVVDGKYVFIRGLGDRYSNTLLNGSSIPSADPDKQSVQMDQFPTDLLESIVTSKSFTPDQPGSFAGGSVNVQIKSFPDDFFITLSASVDYNSQTTGKDIFVSEQGVDWDADGIDDRPRTDVPQNEIPPLSQGRNSSAAFGAALAGDLSVARRLDKITRGFAGPFYPILDEALPSHGGSLSVGDTFVFENESKLGYTVSLTWDRDYENYTDGIEARWDSPVAFKESAQVYTTEPEVLERLAWYSNYWGQAGDPYDGDVPFGVTKSSQSVNWGALGKLAFLSGVNHELSLTAFHNQSAEEEIKHGVGDGFNSALSGEHLFEAVSVLYTERGISSWQLNGKHLFNSLQDLEVEWQVSLSESTQNQPDYRMLFTAWDYENQEYLKVNATDLEPPIRRFREMVEENEEYKVDFTLPILKSSKIKWGVLTSDSVRNYDEITYSVSPLTWQGQPDSELVRAIYTEPYIGFDFEKVIEIDRNGDGEVDMYNLAEAIAGRHFIERGREGNVYEADGSVRAAYLMGDIALAEKWRMITGLRWESNEMSVHQIFQQQDVEDRFGGFDADDVLPALSLVYSINDKQNLRMAYGRTIAKPSYKELSPVEIVDSFTGDRFQGNPDLNRTLIDNVDLRWEWFIDGVEMVAVSAFYKRMEDPIEVLFFGGADKDGDGVLDPDQIFTRGNIVPQNVEEATVYGLEFEWRYALDRLNKHFKNLSFGGNLSLIESEVSVPLDEQVFFGSEDTRQLVGQSPFLFNFNLSYDNDQLGSYVNLFYNFTDERLSVVNPNNKGLGDVFEKGVGRLGITYTQRLNGNIRLKISLKNLLDPDFEKYYVINEGGERVYEKFTRGITGSISLTYTFE